MQQCRHLTTLYLWCYPRRKRYDNYMAGTEDSSPMIHHQPILQCTNCRIPETGTATENATSSATHSAMHQTSHHLQPSGSVRLQGNASHWCLLPILTLHCPASGKSRFLMQKNAYRKYIEASGKPLPDWPDSKESLTIEQHIRYFLMRKGCLHFEVLHQETTFHTGKILDIWRKFCWVCCFSWSRCDIYEL